MSSDEFLNTFSSHLSSRLIHPFLYSLLVARMSCRLYSASQPAIKLSLTKHDASNLKTHLDRVLQWGSSAYSMNIGIAVYSYFSFSANISRWFISSCHTYIAILNKLIIPGEGYKSQHRKSLTPSHLSDSSR